MTSSQRPRRGDLDAIVVGSGPNGLSAAIELARAGKSVRVFEAAATMGGGTRSAELTLPGFVHDVCSAAHPFGPASPFFRSLDLSQRGLEWIHPDVPLAHAISPRRAVLLERSIDATADALGRDGVAWKRLVEPLARHWDDLVGELLRPVLRLPRHPILLARFGIPALAPATALARTLFEGQDARALLGGMSAHSFVDLNRPVTAAYGIVFAVLGHAVGWPVVRGGSGRIADALVAEAMQLGVTFETGHRVRSLDDLPPARAYLLDLGPREALAVAGDRLPAGYRRALGRVRRAPGVFKLDWALSEPIPWTAPGLDRAGTVHLGGTMTDIAHSEAEVIAGRIPARPFILLVQPTRFDPSRAPDGRHTAWAYCHVPNGSTVDMTEAIEDQIERHAPGFRDVILARAVSSPAALEAANPNDAGGDITGGLPDWRGLLFRPTVSWDPYATPTPGIYLCSSSTPPGPGVHGMSGYLAARSALRRNLA